jgi:hypothetical protein
MGIDMATVDGAFGFLPWGNVLRAQWYAVNTAPTIGFYHGDPVEHGGAFVSTPMGYMADVIDAALIANGDVNILGMVLAIADENFDPMLYMEALRTGNGTIAGYLLVADHPDQLFVGQEDSGTNAIDLADGGQNADINVTAGSTTTGRSAAEIDSASIATTSTLHLQVHYPHPDDTPANDAYWCRYIVSINTHYYGRGDGRTGVS